MGQSPLIVQTLAKRTIFVTISTPPITSMLTCNFTHDLKKEREKEGPHRSIKFSQYHLVIHAWRMLQRAEFMIFSRQFPASQKHHL